MANISVAIKRNATNKNQQTNNHNAGKNEVLNKSGDHDEDKERRIVRVVFASLLCDLLAFTMILPLLPSILDHYREHDSSGLYNVLTLRIHWFQQLLGAPERYTSVLYGGFLGSMFSFLQFVASPIVGGLSDYYGRKPMMLICAVGIALSYLLWALSSNFALFVLARFVGGLSKGNISLCMSIITDVSNLNSRSFGMALVGVAFSFGFIAGPMIGAIFARTLNKSVTQWYVAPALCAFTLAMCDLGIIVFKFKETLPKEKRVKQISSAVSYAMQMLDVRSIFKHCSAAFGRKHCTVALTYLAVGVIMRLLMYMGKSRKSFAAIKHVPKAQIESLRKIGMIYFLYLFLYSGLEFTVTFLMFHKFGYNSMNQAKMFLTTGIIMTVLQGGVVRRLPPKATKPSAVFSLYLIVPSFILVGLAEDSRMLYAGMVLFAISTAFAVTCLTTLVSRYGNDDQKGSVLGIFRSLGALARAVGPVVGCIAFWCIGSRLTYIIGGLLLLYPAYVLQRARL